MNLQDFSTLSVDTSTVLNQRLNEMYDLEIDFSTDSEQLTSLLEHYEDKMALLKKSTGNDPEYVKIFLICEAIRIYLREIAPPRKKTRRKK